MVRRKLIHLPGVAGADEAGRGPLAGPVVAAAVVLPDGFDVSGINDSKKLTPAQREELATVITDTATWCVEVVDVEEIDRINILWASMAGMARALERIGAARALIDGNCLPKTTVPVEAVVGGDGKYACIAAASILAKTTRDSLMRDLSLEYPEYGFDVHFGYSTPEHIAALDKHGPCPLHRRSFARISDLINQPCLTFDE